MKVTPWKISDTYGNERFNTGHDYRWDCTVRRDCGGGTALTHSGAEFLAARHAASHTETELASTVVLPAGVTMNADRSLSGPVKHLIALYESDAAYLNDAGDLILI